MTTALDHHELEDRIRATFDDLAATTTISPDARFGERTPQVIELRPERRRWMLPAAAAVAVLALVGGLIAVNRDTTPASTADEMLPAPDATVEPQPTTTIDRAIFDGTLALFPLDASATDAAIFSTPETVVEAYLADRTSPESLPDDLTRGLPDDPAEPAPKLSISYEVGEVERLSIEPNGDGGEQAVVAFTMSTNVDSGDGLALVRQIAAADEPERWVVISAGVSSFGIDEMKYGARLTGSFTSEIGGRTEIAVHSALTGELLGAETLSDSDTTSMVDAPVANTDLVVPTALGRFEFDDITPNALAVRFWNTNAQPGGTPVAVFAEASILRGDTVRDEGRQRAETARESGRTPIFDDGPITTYADLGASGTKVVFDGPIVRDGLQTSAMITARREDTATPYCVDLDFDGQEATHCFTWDAIARPGDTSAFRIGSTDTTVVLVGSIVTDAATTVIAPGGGEITPVGNVWFDVVDSGVTEVGRTTYTLRNADGSRVTPIQITT